MWVSERFRGTSEQNLKQTGVFYNRISQYLWFTAGEKLFLQIRFCPEMHFPKSYEHMICATVVNHCIWSFESQLCLTSSNLHLRRRHGLRYCINQNTKQFYCWAVRMVISPVFHLKGHTVLVDFLNLIMRWFWAITVRSLYNPCNFDCSCTTKQLFK